MYSELNDHHIYQPWYLYVLLVKKEALLVILNLISTLVLQNYKYIYKKNIKQKVS